MSHLISAVELAEAMASLAIMGVAKVSDAEQAIRQANERYCEVVFQNGDSDSLEFLSQRIGKAHGSLVLKIIGR